MDNLINEVYQLSEEMVDIVTLTCEGDGQMNQRLASLNQFITNQMEKLIAIDEQLDKDLELVEKRMVLGQENYILSQYLLAHKPIGASLLFENEEDQITQPSPQPNSDENSFINDMAETPHNHQSQYSALRNIQFSNASSARRQLMSPMDSEPNNIKNDVIQLVSESEFDIVPNYLKCRMKVCTVNEFLSVLNTVITKKYEYLSKPRSACKSNEKIFDMYSKWQSQSTQLQLRERFCTAQDFVILNNFKLSKKEHNLISILRHLGRLKQKQIKDVVYYIASGISV